MLRVGPGPNPYSAGDARISKRTARLLEIERNRARLSSLKRVRDAACNRAFSDTLLNCSRLIVITTIRSVNPMSRSRRLKPWAAFLDLT